MPKARKFEQGSERVWLAFCGRRCMRWWKTARPGCTGWKGVHLMDVSRPRCGCLQGVDVSHDSEAISPLTLLSPTVKLPRMRNIHDIRTFPASVASLCPSHAPTPQHRRSAKTEVCARRDKERCSLKTASVSLLRRQHCEIQAATHHASTPRIHTTHAPRKLHRKRPAWPFAA